MQVNVTVKNTGSRSGTEIVQLYMQDVTASLVRPVKELKGFMRVELLPGQEKEAVFYLNKQDMGFYDNEGNYRLEDGSFYIYAGPDSRACLKECICLHFQ